jgi:hypothetical protein
MAFPSNVVLIANRIMATARIGLGSLHSLRSCVSRRATRLPFDRTVAATIIALRGVIGHPKNFSLYFCLDRPQYVVVLTDHGLDALSEMR